MLTSGHNYMAQVPFIEIILAFTSYPLRDTASSYIKLNFDYLENQTKPSGNTLLSIYTTDYHAVVQLY